MLPYQKKFRDDIISLIKVEGVGTTRNNLDCLPGGYIYVLYCNCRSRSRSCKNKCQNSKNNLSIITKTLMTLSTRNYISAMGESMNGTDNK